MKKWILQLRNVLLVIVILGIGATIMGGSSGDPLADKVRHILVFFCALGLMFIEIKEWRNKKKNKQES